MSFPLSPHLQVQHKVLTDLIAAFNASFLARKYAGNVPPLLKPHEEVKLDYLWEYTLSHILQSHEGLTDLIKLELKKEQKANEAK